MPPATRGYILPADQIIRMAAENFSKFETLEIAQSTQREENATVQEVLGFKERVWIKRPGLVRSDILNDSLVRPSEPDAGFRLILLSNGWERLSRILSSMGIDLTRASFDRVNDVVAYRIGVDNEESPAIFIEKERFLPLFLRYRTSGRDRSVSITVEFNEYRKLEQGWYPFEITYREKEGFKETYRVDQIQVNVPMDRSLFDAVEVEASNTSSRPADEDERLRSIIKNMEKRYGN
jgi:hypothetical protein